MSPRTTGAILLLSLLLAAIAVLVMTMRGDRSSAAVPDPRARVEQTPGVPVVAPEGTASDRQSLPSKAREPEPNPSHEPRSARRNTFVSGIAVNEDLEPLHGRNLDWAAVCTDRGADGAQRAVAVDQGSTATDAEGAFRIELDERRFDCEGPLELALRAHYKPDDDHRAARVRLAGESDLGSVVLSLPQVMLAGVTLDATGAPLPGIGTRARRSNDAENVPGPAEDTFPAYSNAAGRFQIVGWGDGLVVDLSANSPDWTNDPLRGLVTPALDLRVVMRPLVAASIRVQLVMDNAESARPTTFRAKRTDAGPNEVWIVASIDYQRGDRFIRPMLPGEYALEVFDSRTEFVFGRFEGVRVPESQEADDARLHPVDLRGKLRRLRVRSVDSNGAAAPWNKIQVVNAAGQKDELITDRDGFFEIRLPSGAAELEATDCYGIKHRLVDGAEIVVFKR